MAIVNSREDIPKVGDLVKEVVVIDNKYENVCEITFKDGKRIVAHINRVDDCQDIKEPACCCQEEIGL